MNLGQQYYAKLESRQSYIEATRRIVSQLIKTKEVFNAQTDNSIAVVQAEADRQIQWIDEDLHALVTTIGCIPPPLPAPDIAKAA
jgi:hypothetical protein